MIPDKPVQPGTGPATSPDPLDQALAALYARDLAAIPVPPPPRRPAALPDSPAAGGYGTRTSRRQPVPGWRLDWAAAALAAVLVMAVFPLAVDRIPRPDWRPLAQGFLDGRASQVGQVMADSLRDGIKRSFEPWRPER